MASVEGLGKLTATLDRLKRKFGPVRASVAVGYEANYALYVHETFVPAPGATKHARFVGQGKYLEQPARELSNSGELGRVVVEAAKGGSDLQQGLFLAGLRLQRESQEKFVPVDTGNLKASAFTRKE